jgi:hypothetical protein
MSASKDEVVEKLRIQHALVAAGYYAYSIKKTLGTDSIEVHARKYCPGDDERLIAGDAEPLKNV